MLERTKKENEEGKDRQAETSVFSVTSAVVQVEK